MARRELDLIGTIQHTAQGGAMTIGLLGGVGTNANPAVTTFADKNFFDYRMKSSCATGTARGIYAKLYLTGGSGGEAGRFFTDVSAAAPVDTVNGMHNSIQFGTSAGNVTGLATATRNTFMVPNRALTGTCAAVMAELWADGTSTSVSGTTSFFRACLGGNATGLAAIEDSAYLFEIAGGTNATGNIVTGVESEPTWSTACYKIRVKVNGVVAYLVAVTGA